MRKSIFKFCAHTGQPPDHASRENAKKQAKRDTRKSQKKARRKTR